MKNIESPKDFRCCFWEGVVAYLSSRCVSEINVHSREAVEGFTAMRRALDEILEDNSMETLRLPLVEARNSCISDNCGSYRGVGSEIISACSGAHWDNSRPGVLLLEMQPRYAKSLLGQLPDDRRAIIEQVGSAFIGVQKAAIQNAVEPVREMDGF